MLELEAVLAALRAYRDRCKGQPLKVAAVNRCIGIVLARLVACTAPLQK